MKRVNVATECGTWYYKKVTPNAYNDYDETVWVLYDHKKEMFSDFGYRWELLEWVEQWGSTWAKNLEERDNERL